MDRVPNLAWRGLRHASRFAPNCGVRHSSSTATSFFGSATAAIHADTLDASCKTSRFSTDFDVAPPISMTTTFTNQQDNLNEHIYSRISGPSRSRCEALLGSIEGTPEVPAHAVLYSSGLAACFAVLSRLLPKRVHVSGGYHGTHLVLQQLHRISRGSGFQVLPLPGVSEVASAVVPGDLIWLETPINPTCDVADIAAYSAAAKEVGGVSVVVDGTFAPPPLQRPLTLGADAVMHATTKALAGHSDVMGGAVCVASEDLAQELRDDRVALGSTPGSMEVWLLMRSLRTLHLRVTRQSQTAAVLAAWLERATGQHPDSEHPLKGLIHAVHHPSLPRHRSNEVASRQMVGGYGGCMAIELASEAAAKALPAATTLFRDATSLGGVESLIEWRRKYDEAVSPLLLRLSVGLEDPEHLQADLQKAILSVSASAGR